MAPLTLLADSTPSVRIALLKDVETITLHGRELRVSLPEAKPVGYTLSAPARVRATAEGLQVGDGQYPFASVRIESLEPPITINERRFEGTIEIQKETQNTLLVVNELPMETYLIGLIHGEVDASWPIEAVKAQAVAGRTYALFRQKQRRAGKNNRYDLESGHTDQVYTGSAGAADLPAQKAIEATRGEVLWFLGLFPAYYHSACGGMTETVQKVWGRSESSASVADPFCKHSPFQRWELNLSPKGFLKTLRAHGLEGKQIKNISLEKGEDSVRNAIVVIETDKMSLFIKAEDLRRILGYDRLKSTWFEIFNSPRSVLFRGQGYGHGVGMCQWGAKAMAEAGKNYRQILEFYYPKAVVRRVY